MVDNFELIKSLLKFENENEFYFVQIIQRKKDAAPGQVLGTNNNSRCIKTFCIYSLQELERYKAEMIALCNVFNARAGILMNRRNAERIAFKMMRTLAVNMENGQVVQLASLHDSMCTRYHQEKNKLWLVDLDHIEEGSTAHEKMINYIDNTLRPYKTKYITTIPSKDGCHLLSAPFDSWEFEKKFPDIKIQKNSPTNLYIP